MFPIFLDVSDRLGVVIGGGKVGQRKAQSLLDAGARIRIIALEVPPSEMHAALEWRTEPYAPQHLTGAALVIAAATPAVNRQVVADARAQGLWVNSATEPAASDFTMAATLRRGDLTVAIGTGGQAPGLARAVRDLLAETLDDTIDQWLRLLAELRPWLHNHLVDESQRRALLQPWCSLSALERIRREGVAAVRAAWIAQARTLVSSLPEPL